MLALWRVTLIGIGYDGILAAAEGLASRFYSSQERYVRRFLLTILNGIVCGYILSRIDGGPNAAYVWIITNVQVIYGCLIVLLGSFILLMFYLLVAIYHFHVIGVDEDKEMGPTGKG
jgi:hypothetical protein